MAQKKDEPKVTWTVTNTGLAAQQALSDKAKRAKVARRAPARKVQVGD